MLGGGNRKGIQESAGSVFSLWPSRIVCWGLALVFFYAGTVKLMDPKAFARSISQYDLAPDFLLPVLAIGLPMVEILGAVGLIFAIRGSLSLIFGLLLLFAAVLWYGILNGLDADCGCFSPEELQAFCKPQEFHDALLQIGAKPGNNLTFHSSGEVIGGDELLVSVTWPGLSRPLGLADVPEDSSGKGFRIRFGGNRQRAVEEQTGCITCLESCPIGISSNAAYPALNNLKRLLSANSQFKEKAENLPRQRGLILIDSK
jgi:hypothetical protein